MNTTIAVTIITAVSTLAGGVIASIASIRIQTRQAEAQRNLAADERRDKREASRKEILQQAFVLTVDHQYEMQKHFDECWGSTYISLPRFMCLIETMDKFTQAYTRFSVDTPPDVADLVIKFKRTLSDEVGLLSQAASEPNPEGLPLRRHQGEAFRKVQSARGEALANLLQTIRRSVDAADSA